MESVADLQWNGWLIWTGIRNQFPEKFIYIFSMADIMDLDYLLIVVDFVNDLESLGS